MFKRSSAKNGSKGTPTLKTLDIASSIFIKSNWLWTEPWWTDLHTNFKLFTVLRTDPHLTNALFYMACTKCTIDSSIPTLFIVHQRTLLWTLSKAFYKLTKANYREYFTPLRSCIGRCCFWSCQLSNMTSVVPLPETKANYISSMTIISGFQSINNILHDFLNDFHHILCVL